MAQSILVRNSTDGKFYFLRGNSNGDAYVQLTGSNAPLSGQINVTTAGTRVALGGDQEYKKIIIIAKTTNTGNIFLGNSTVTSVNGAILPAGGVITLEFVNTNEIYIDSAVSGEGVSWIGVI